MKKKKVPGLLVSGELNKEMRFKPRNNTKTKLSLGNMTITVNKFIRSQQVEYSVGARKSGSTEVEA